MFNLSLARIAAIAVATLVVLIYVISGWTSVQPGEFAIQVKQFGDDRGVIPGGLGVGTHWIDPLMYDVVTYDTRAHQQSMNIDASTKDGQPVKVAVSFEISLVPDLVGTLHQTIGPDYFNRVVAPAAQSAILDAVPTQLSDQIYTGEGRNAIQNAIQAQLTEKHVPDRGIMVRTNLREVTFTNPDFIKVLEAKAGAAQQEEINRRYALAAAQNAIKVANDAEGQKQVVIKQSEASKAQAQLRGEGSRIEKENEAQGLLAMATAEAKGVELRRQALSGPGGPELVSIEWAKNLAPKLQVYGFPTGAPGTTSILDINSVFKGALKGVADK